MSALDLERRKRFELARIRSLVSELEYARNVMMRAVLDLAHARAHLECYPDEESRLERLAEYRQGKRGLTDAVRAYRQWRRELEDAVFNACFTKRWVVYGEIGESPRAIFADLFGVDASGVAGVLESELFGVEESEHHYDERCSREVEGEQ
jgi:hypothetical protein